MKYAFTYLFGWFLLVGTVCTAQRFPVDTLQKTGPPDKRINVVILGDGYTDGQLPKFDQDAKAFASFFLSYTPYNAYKDYFNVFAIRTPSKESGATNPGTAPDRYASQPIETRDTFYGSSFGSTIHRSVSIRKYQTFTNVMATNLPDYDLAIMIVNSPWYGGSGGNPATFTTHELANLVGIHEIGHSFSFLADEYWPDGGYETPNMTRKNTPATITWKNWLNQFNVGIYPHSGTGDAAVWHKPTTQNCLMEQLNRPFCAVCREATTNRILQLVEPVEGLRPQPGSRIVVGNTPEPFQLTLLKPNPNTLRVEWRLNGAVLTRDSERITIAINQLTDSTNTLTASVLDTTTNIRLESHRQQHTYTYRWTLNKPAAAPLLAISASKDSLCMGESATLTAANCSGSVTWSTGATSLSIAVSPTQPTTYSVSCTTNGPPRTASRSVMVLPVPVAGTTNTGPYFDGQTVQLRAQGGVGYAWSGPAGFTSSEQNPTIPAGRVSQAGAYTVTVTAPNGCVSQSQTIVSISPLLAVSRPSADAVRVFPNPAKGSFQVRTVLPGESEMTLTDGTGREVLKKSFYQMVELAVGTLRGGLYLYRVTNGGQTHAGKLLIDR